jgi:cytochrome c oxidase subunit 2
MTGQLRPAFGWVAAPASGSEAVQSALDSAGPVAGRIESYWWLIFGISAAVLVLVVLATLYALFHRQRGPGAEPEPFQPVERERRRGRIVGVFVGLTALILLGLLAASLSTDRAVSGFASGNALSIEVIGHQWWWEVRYHDPLPANQIVTANEIHVPVGRTVALLLKSRDVIHSFWAPNLAGKMDLIPGHDATLNFRADRAGVFRGQCAEFCGYQHAGMGFLVVAEPPEQFAAWLDKQRTPAVPPANSKQLRGQQVFLAGDCSFCHAIQGTEAGGKVAPDLTHLASRSMIAAAMLPNKPGQLAAWIVDSQRLKPGNHMPPHALAGADLQALLAYLGSLR